MSVAQHTSEAEYEQIVLAEPIQKWELYEGRLREKPGMTWKHGDIIEFLGYLLRQQLDRNAYRVRENEGRVRKLADTIFIPDIAVVPVAYGEQFRDRPVLAIFSDPLPLIVEVWSRSTGDYDVDAKLPVYQQRGDLEIWRIHPYERTLTAWVRQPDGMYEETVHREGTVRPVALPDVEITLSKIFEP